MFSASCFCIGMMTHFSTFHRLEGLLLFVFNVQNLYYYSFFMEKIQGSENILIRSVFSMINTNNIFSKTLIVDALK